MLWEGVYGRCRGGELKRVGEFRCVEVGGWREGGWCCVEWLLKVWVYSRVVCPEV